jgi:sarcosine oxidase, subunit gamma
MVEALARRSALADLADAMAAASVDGVVTLRELPFRAQVNLRADPTLDLGLPLPTDPNTTTRDADHTLLWLGPDEWLVLAPDGAQAEIERALREALARAGAWGSVVDVSAQRTTLELRGPRARDVLATGCSLDLHPRAFGPGRCAQTALERAQVVLHQLDDEPTYELLVAASFAAYAAEWLMDAMEEHRER